MGLTVPQTHQQDYPHGVRLMQTNAGQGGQAPKQGHGFSTLAGGLRGVTTFLERGWRKP